MHRRKVIRIADLRVIEGPTHEPVVLGDFVRLASGSPQGLVIDLSDDQATVAWLSGQGLRTTLPAVCLRPNAVRHC